MAAKRSPKKKFRKAFQEKLFNTSEMPEPLISSKILKKLKGASITLLDKNMRVIWANKYLEEIHGPLPELQGEICFKIYHRRKNVCPDCVPSKALKTGLISTGTLTRKSKDGSSRYLQSVGVPFLDAQGEPQRVLEILFDVTKSKLLELGLEKSEEFYRTLFEYSGTAITVNNKQGIMTSVNRRFCDLSGYPRKEIEGKMHYLDFVVDKDRVKKIHEKRWSRKGVSPTKYEYIFKTRSGEKRLIEITTNRIPGTDSQIASMIDLTEKKKLEKEIREKEQFLANIMKESADGIIVIDEQNIIRTWNKGAEQIFGYKADKIIGKKIDLLVPKDKIKSGEIEHLHKKCNSQGFVRNFITERIRKDKRHVIVSQTVTLIKGEHQRPDGYALIIRDITDTKRLEQQLIQNEKMSALGTLSASLAHEIKNPLNSIVINMEILKNHLADKSHKPLTKYTNIIQNEVERLDKVIKDFLNYAKPQSTQYKAVDINEVILTVMELLENESKNANVVLNKKFEKNIYSIHGEENQLKQIILNLVLNSIQAMPNGGSITIETKNKSDGSVFVTLTDTGKGIKRIDQKAIFDPFFTTKREGSGLGLPMVAQLVKNHGGEIIFKSKPGVGTTFYLSFPSVY